MDECSVAQLQQCSEFCAHEPASKCNIPYTYKSIPSFSGSVGCNTDHHTPKGGDEEGVKWVSVQWGDPKKGPYLLKMPVHTALLCPIAGGYCSGWLSPEPALAQPSLMTGYLTHIMPGQDPHSGGFRAETPKQLLMKHPLRFPSPTGL